LSASTASGGMLKAARLLALAAAIALGLSALLIGTSVGAWRWVAASILGLAGAVAFMLAISGRLVVRRQLRLEKGLPDLFLDRNECRSESAALAGQVPPGSGLRRIVAHRMFGHRFLPGDTVRVRSRAAIDATLDERGALDSLPFMEEMASFCGRTARVYRVVDKIYDYGRSRQMRRLDGCVLLAGWRCDGMHHGGCEAACYLIWKADWLEPALDDDAPQTLSGTPQRAQGQPPYHCQYTTLTQSSHAVPEFNLRGLLGPLIVGNLTLSAWLIAVATRGFNAFQEWRGGAAFPARPDADGQAAPVSTTLSTGEWVRIRMPWEIARTLDKRSKNRGLWFDRDMLKFCGQMYQVRSRVTKIIDVATLDMIPMKTPCITLRDVHYTGEFQGFGEQHDFLYWREAWLERCASPLPDHGAAS
jgi:hypothetical protein